MRPPRRPAPLHGRRAVLWVMSIGTAMLSCILPDIDIEIEDAKILNRTPVRIVEPRILPPDLDLECDPNPDDNKLVVCPQPPTDPRRVLPHYLDPGYVEINDDVPFRPYYFCSCAQDQVDNRALIYNLYVEDQDEKPRTRVPRDDIYAALFRDLPPHSPDPFNYRDYIETLNPELPLDLADVDYSPLSRRDPHLREIILGDTDFPLDLCNGGGSVLQPGIHTLTVMVTDKPWWVNENGATLVGIPDVAAGATFDTVTYVFHCHASVDDKLCQCVNPNEGGS